MAFTEQYSRRGDDKKHIPELDGLRAIAIFGVLLFHLHVPGFGLGWAGVQLFFALSGFLITGILLNSKNRDHYFSRFYIRRTLRIFPIYYLSLALILIYAVNKSAPHRDTPWYFFYLQNYLLGLTANHAEFPAMFSHTWSLAVEEQFYLLWPLMVWLLSTRRLVVLCGSLIVGSVVFRPVIASINGNYYLSDDALPGCVATLAAGALLAILFHHRPQLHPLNHLRPLLAVGLLGASLVFIPCLTTGAEYPDSTHAWTPGWPAVMREALMLGILLGSLCLVAICVVDKAIPRLNALRQVVRSRPLVHIGQISYGIYLYHPLCFQFVGNGLLRMGCSTSNNVGFWLAGALQLLAAYMVALISYKYVESPLLKLKSRF